MGYYKAFVATVYEALLCKGYTEVSLYCLGKYGPVSLQRSSVKLFCCVWGGRYSVKISVTSIKKTGLSHFASKTIEGFLIC
jgi:hypothetical protein